MNPIFQATIKNGKIATHNRERLQEYIRTRPDGQYEIIVRKPRKPRSLKENNYYWGVVIEIIRQSIGLTPEEAHEAMKWEHLKRRVGKLTTVGSTTELSTVEMEDYLSKIRQFASKELSLYIPQPNEVDYKLVNK